MLLRTSVASTPPAQESHAPVQKILGGVIAGAGLASLGVVAVVGLAVLWPAERRRRAPLLKLSLFASRPFDAINVMTVLFYGALGASSYLVFLQCELRLGYSAAQAGAALIPESVVFLFLAPVSGRLVARLGARWMMVAGIAATAAALFWLSAAHPGQSYAVAILPGVLLWGLGIGVAVTPLTAAVLAAVGAADLGEASGINDAASRVGGVVVIALVPVLGVSLCLWATTGSLRADVLWVRQRLSISCRPRSSCRSSWS